MATYKCKMCGGLLEVKEGQTVVTCEFCGTAQTVPHFDNEKKATFFRRANDLRLKCEFDKASGVYETIVTEFPNEAEAYWGLVLCKYGIEYVDDPKTHKKIPTCHRTQFSSIFEDHDYLSAVKHADAVAREIYKSEANAISKLQSAILEISSKEDPFDVFICYKETDERGGRTADSVLAQDIYDELTSAGYKVFFARRTLERKLGSEYEPYIFAALHSAKVMLHVTTSKNNSDSVWVRNEWARYLSLIAEGQKKTLIPCYKGISAYDLPEEIKNLQAQDMSKIGAMQDLIYGIKKIIKPAGRVVTHEVEKEESFASDTGFDGLIRKGYTYLKNNKIEQAQKCFDKAVEATELCGDAYLGMVLCEYELESLEELLAQSDLSILDNENFKLAREFANKSCNATLDKVEKAIIDNEKKGRYNQAKSALDAGRFDAAIEGFKELSDFEDSPEQIKECVYQKGQMYFGYISDIRSLGYCDDAIACFEEVVSYKDSKAMIEKANSLRAKITEEYKASCIERYLIALPKDVTLLTLGELVKSVKANRDRVFNPSFSEFDNARAEAEAGIIKFFNEKCPALIQSFNTLDECSKLTGLCFSIEKDGNLKSVHELIKQREHEIKEQIRALKKKRRKKGAIITAITCGALAVAVATFFGIKAIVDENNRKATYASANTAMESGNYDDAIAYYESLGNYNESQKKIQVCNGLKQLEASIESKSEADAIKGIKTIVSAGEKVDVAYETENNVNVRRLAGGNSGNKTETIETVDFTLYQPTWSGYTFLNWNSESLSYKSERTHLGLMSNWSLNSYTITYNLDGGTNDSRNPSVYSIESPDITIYPASKYGYTFKGWTSGNETIETIHHGSLGNITLTANWEINKYEVKFVNYDDTLLYSTVAEHGSSVSYVGSTPERPADAQYTYTFSGWDGQLSNIVSDTTFKAQYSTVTNSYTVRFFNYDNSLLQTVVVKYGNEAVYTASTPTKPISNDDLYAYSFAGWSQSVSYITGDLDVIAQFTTINRYLATFKNYDGTVLQSSRFNSGTTPSYNGATPTKPSDVQYGYTFSGWSPTLSAITKDTVYTAQFSSHSNYYNAKFYNYDGTTLLETYSVAYGSYATYTGSTPTKPKTQQYTYTFTGWDKNPATTPIVEDTNFIAQFSSSVNQYTVTFKNYDGAVLGADTVAYGDSATYSGNTPTKPADYCGYRFSGLWTTTNGGSSIDDLTNVVANRTVYARFNNISYSNVGLNDFNVSNAGTVTEDGRLFLYGTTPNGGCADAPVISEGSSYLPANGHEVVIDGETFADVTIGNGFGFGLTTSGKIYSWGNESYCKLGNGREYHYVSIGNGQSAQTSSVSTPEQILNTDGVHFVKVVALNIAGYALTDQGEIYAWGGNTSGFRQYGDYSSTPFKIVTDLRFVDICSTPTSVLALSTDGDVYGWGQNSQYEFGNSYSSSYGGNDISYKITMLSDGVKKFKSIKTGYSSIAAISTTGELYMAGYSTNGLILGDSGSGSKSFGKYYSYNLNVKDVDLGRDHGMLVTTDGKIYTWGSNEYGALGIGKAYNEDARSTSLMELDFSGISISIEQLNPRLIRCGYYSNYVVTNDGKVLTWGYGNNYILGDDNRYSSNVVRPQVVLYRGN